MKSRSRIALGIAALLFASGCASVKVVEHQTLVKGRLPRPGNILVYDFVACAADVPADEGLSGQESEGAAAQTQEEIALGREVGAEIAGHLVAAIRAMGMPAGRAAAGSKARVDDLVVRGYLLSVREGSATKRFVLGFASGSSELKTAVDVLQMTARGLRRVESSDLDARGNEMPGTAVGIATFLATGVPAGLLLGGALKIFGERSGRNKIEGRADQTAKEIADELKKKFQEQGWI